MGLLKRLELKVFPAQVPRLWLLDVAWLKRKLKMYEIDEPKNLAKMTKIVAGKQLWNYDNLEPSEKKLVL